MSRNPGSCFVFRICIRFLLPGLMVMCFSAPTEAQTSTAYEDSVIANNLFEKGTRFGNAAEFDSAVSCLDSASVIFLRIGDWENLVRCHNAIGDHYRKQGKYDEALKVLDEALYVGTKKLGPGAAVVSKTCHGQGNVYFLLGRFDEAIEYFNRSVEIRLALDQDDGIDLARTYNNLGVVYDEKGDYDRSVEYYEKSIELKKSLLGEEHASLATGYGNLGIIYAKLGDYARSIAFFNQSLAISLAAGPQGRIFVAASYDNLGIIYTYLHDFDHALEYHNKALPLRLDLFGEQHPEVANNYDNIGMALKGRGSYAEALIFLEKALDIREALLGPDHVETALSFSNLAKVYDARGDFATAFDFFYKALKIRESALGSTHPDVAENYLEIGLVYENQKKYESALYYFQKAVQVLVPEFVSEDPFENPAVESIKLGADVLEVLNAKTRTMSRFYREQGSAEGLMAAESAFALAGDLIDRLRKEYRAERSKLSLGSVAREIYKNALGNALALAHVFGDSLYFERAFFYAEKSKANVLIEALADLNAKRFAGIPDSLIEKERKLRIDLTYHEKRSIELTQKQVSSDSLKLLENQNKLFTVRSSIEALAEAVERDYPEYYEVKYGPRVTTPGAAREKLDTVTAVLSYFLADDEIHLFYLDAKRFQVISTNVGDSFADQVRDFHDRLRKKNIVQDRHRLAFGKQAHDLFKILIDPVSENLVGKKKLIVVPEAQLFYLPFEALISKPDSNVGFVDMDFLVHEYEISYQYALSLFLGQSTQGGGMAPGGFAGFAPVFESGSEGAALTQENRDFLLGVASDSASAGFPVVSGAFNVLPESAGEVDLIADVFRAHGLGASVFLNSAATERQFKSMPPVRFVHVATHGFMNENRPRLSGLAFAQIPDSTAGEDGILFAAEAYDLELSADLVVLSSCESGLGKLVQGEGMISMTRGFLYSGVQNVLFSLWKVSDRHTRDLMVEFYGKLLAGDSFSGALRQAKLKLLQNEISAVPRNWSGFVLIGR